MKDIQDALSFYSFNIIVCSMFGSDFYGGGDVLKVVFDKGTVSDAYSLLKSAGSEKFELLFKVNTSPYPVYGSIVYKGGMMFKVSYKTEKSNNEIDVSVYGEVNGESGTPFSYFIDGVSVGEIALFGQLELDPSVGNDINKFIEFGK